MPILSKEDLIKAINQRRLNVSDHLPLSAFSLDVRLGRLFRHNAAYEERLRKEKHILRDWKLTRREFLDTYTDEIEIPKTGVILPPHSFWLWTPKEEIYLGEGLHAEICSRSSYARIGCMSKQILSPGINHPADEEFSSTFKGHPSCALHVEGTTVQLSTEDALAQLVVSEGIDYVQPEEYQRMFQRGDLVIKKNGKPLDQVRVITNPSYGIELTMSKDIWVYRPNGKTLRRGSKIEDHFERMTLPEQEEDAISLPKGTFFISASEEEVAIPDTHVGYVLERGFLLHTNFSTHPNAPYIGPKSIFEGKITFENYVHHGGTRLHQGILQSTLELRPLKTPLDSDAQESRYKGQAAATLSRI